MMDWSALPYELEEAIMGCLSLPELADVSTTCKRFDQVFRQMLAKEQTARCEIAFSQLGRKRVARVADIVHSFFSTQLLGSPSRERVKCYWWTAEDGTLHVAETAPPDRGTGENADYCWSISEDGKLHAWEAPQPGTNDISVRVQLVSHPAMLMVNVSAHNGSSVLMIFTRRLIQSSSSHNRFFFSVRPCDDEDVLGVALLQALVCGDFAPIVREGCPHSDVHIEWGDHDEGFTSAGLESQVAPLLPLVKSSGVSYLNRVVKHAVRERREDGQVASSVNRNVKLHVRVWLV
jgi:hypothetical protein